MPLVDVSILIVSYNTRDLTLACLRSVYDQTRNISFEVLVVDNASGDGSAQAIAREFPQVRLIQPGRNLGFAAANNLAAGEAAGEYLLLLNPDTLVLDGAVQKMHAFAVCNPEAGIIGGRTLYGDGSLNPTSCWGRPTLWSCFCRAMGLSTVFRNSRWFDRESLGTWARDTVRDVDIVTGCLLMTSAETWHRLSGFDLGFVMYAEDADLCLRARREGLRCVICPDASIVHYRGASEPVRSDKTVRLFVAKARLYRKHWSPGAAQLGVLLLSLLVFNRVLALWLLRWIRPGARQSCETWLSIWRRRKEWAAEAQPMCAQTSRALSIPTQSGRP